MKVLALTSNYRICGRGLAAHNIAHNLGSRGHDIHFQVFDSNKDLKGYFKGPAYKVRFRPSVPLMPSTGLHVLKQVLHLLKLHRSENFDLALCMDASDAGALGSAFAKEAGLPVACIGWGNELHGLGRTEVGFLRGADLFLPVSRWAKTTFIKAGFDEDRMKMLPLGVDVEVFKPPTERPRGLGMVTVTDLERGCGVDKLIDTLTLLLERGNDAWLTVVGKGSELKALKKQAKDNLLEELVRFKGKVEPAQMPDILRTHHILALIPRKIWGEAPKDFSLAMLEAAACGLGIVGTDIGGLADSLRRCNGSKAPAENIEKIAAVIEKVALRSTTTDGIEELFGRMRTWEEVALELEMVLDDLVYE